MRWLFRCGEITEMGFSLAILGKRHSSHADYHNQAISRAWASFLHQLASAVLPQAASERRCRPNCRTTGLSFLPRPAELRAQQINPHGAETPRKTPDTGL